MSNSFMVLLFNGPIQSWGVDSQFNYRKTGLMPTKSAIAGMCCAAFGYERGCNKEGEFLLNFDKTKLLIVSIPKLKKQKEDEELKVSRMRDYHTVARTRKAKDGKINKKNSQLTYRYYVQDAMFGALLEGESTFLTGISNAFNNPVWGISLGRKSCIPSSPVHVNNSSVQMLFDTKEKALKYLLKGKSLKEFTHQFDVETFEDGDDSLTDNALSFGSIETKREYSPRRVKNITRLLNID